MTSYWYWMWQVWPWDPCCFLAVKEILRTVWFAYPLWIISYKLGTQGNSSDCEEVIFLHGIAIGIVYYCDYVSINMTCSWSVWLMMQDCSGRTELHEVNIKMNNIIHRPTASFTLHQEVPAGMALYNKLWPKSKCLSNHKANVEFLLTHTIQTDEYVNSKMMNSSLSSMCVTMCKFCFLFSNVSFSASFWSVV